MTESCVFCRIVNGHTPSHIVYEDSLLLAFLDHRPLFPGHTLLVPRSHYDTLLDLPSALIAPLFAATQRLARAVERAVEAEGSFVAINTRVSQSVPHLHIHIVPRRYNDGLKGFFWPRQPYKDQDSMTQTQKALQHAIKAL
jgi:histidine triad (HIT) family protein